MILLRINLPNFMYFEVSASLPSPPFPFPPLPLEVGPRIQLGGLGERCKLPQRGLGRSPSRNRFLVHFSPEIRHLVAKTLMIFLRINLPNFMYFEVYQTWTGGDGNCFLSRPIILQVMQNNSTDSRQLALLVAGDVTGWPMRALNHSPLDY